MNPRFVSSRFLAAIAALVFVATACGSTGSGTPPASKGTLTVAGFNFPESSILAEIYGQALAHDGYTITYKLLLGTREVVAPALESGQIDLYPGYAATDLEFYNKSAGEAN
jgi:osmoprotectant transport system substrate-binding protein